MNDKGKLKSPSLVSKQLKIVRATKLSNENKAKIVMRPGRFSDTAPYTLVISMWTLVLYKVSARCKERFRFLFLCLFERYVAGAIFSCSKTNDEEGVPSKRLVHFLKF